MDEQTNSQTPTNAQTNAAQEPKKDVALPLTGNWPGAFGIYKYSRRAVLNNFDTLAVIWVLVIVVSILLGLLFGGHNHKDNGGSGLSGLIGAFAAVGYTRVYITAVRGGKMSLGQAFADPWMLWLKLIVLEILIGLSLLVSFLLLVIPFFFVLPRLSLATYFLIDKDMGIIDAYKASWDSTKGHSGMIWGIIGAAIAMALLMITIIGIPFAIYFLIMYSAAMAVAYNYIAGAQPAPTAVKATEPAPAPPAAPAAV
jgi:hypothetical protein